MLVVTGIFDKETFVPDTPVAIPQKKKVKVIIEEEPVDSKTYARKWRELGEAILICDEKLVGEPVPVRFRTPAGIDAL